VAENKEKQYLSENARLMVEWNWERNTNIDLSRLTLGSGKKVWWKCSKGHEWEATIASRNSGHGCPYCSGQKVLKGYNDLQTLNPELAKEWNCEKNGDLKPDNVTANNNKKVWWKCQKGHEWQAMISDRNGGCGCPYCAGKKVLNGFNDLQTVNPELAKEWNWEKNGDLRPEHVTANSGKKVWWICHKGHEWQAVIASRNGGNGCPVCNSERATSFPEYALEYYLKKYGLDVIHTYREKGYELDIYIPSKKIAIEYDGAFWHADKTKRDLEKNLQCKKDGIKLYRIREGLLPLNDSSIDYIVKQKDLPIVLEKILSEILGFHVDVDLERDAIDIENLREHTEKERSVLTLNPELAKEWNYKKNGKLRPETFSVSSGKNVWWKCKNGHEWKATIASRNRGNGCPYCSGNKVLKGYNDLQTINPELAKEWNYEKNGNLRPDNVTANSSRKVWWKCPKGHEWKASIAYKNNKGGCPICSGKKVLKGFNDLQTKNLELAKEWDFEKNGDLKPNAVTENSKKKVWWKCSKGHSWDATVQNRNRGSGCPYCSGNKVWKGDNDLQTINPTLASEWNCEKNNGLMPTDVTANSHYKVWWKCPKGHEWEATVASRSSGNRCPICAGQKVLEGYNDLQTLNPTLAKEWHPTKNGALLPTMVRTGSGQKVWWICSKGHEWEADISSRNKGNGCPVCASKKVLEGDNDLQTSNSTLASEWNYEKNNGLTPADVTANSHKKVWWKCSKGHEWEAIIKTRNNGNGCPVCANKKVLKGYNDLQTINPKLASEWNYEKNIGLSPTELTPKSDKKVWWKCEKGHEWEASVKSRSYGTGCPECAKMNRKKSI